MILVPEHFQHPQRNCMPISSHPDFPCPNPWQPPNLPLLFIIGSTSGLSVWLLLFYHLYYRISRLHSSLFVWLCICIWLWVWMPMPLLSCIGQGRILSVLLHHSDVFSWDGISHGTWSWVGLQLAVLLLLSPIEPRFSHECHGFELQFMLASTLPTEPSPLPQGFLSFCDLIVLYSIDMPHFTYRSSLKQNERLCHFCFLDNINNLIWNSSAHLWIHLYMYTSVFLGTYIEVVFRLYNNNKRSLMLWETIRLFSSIVVPF